jgi:hypothetical protein
VQPTTANRLRVEARCLDLDDGFLLDCGDLRLSAIRLSSAFRLPTRLS